VFFLNYAATAPGVISRVVYFGAPTRGILTGDYEGDGKTDIATFYSAGSSLLGWVYEPSTAPGTYVATTRGSDIFDLAAPGDYDGDGKTNLAVFRSNPNPDQNFFYVKKSSDGGLLYQEWGEEFDIPVAVYDVH
jgi:hypothetical protein